VIRLAPSVMDMRFMDGRLALVFAASFGSLTGFFLMLSVVPMEARSTTDAGLVTGVLLLGTVLAELVASALARRFGNRLVLAVGALLLGLPSLTLMSGGSPVVLATASFARGVGFGLCGVITGALVTLLLPADRRGEGLGLLGVVDGVPAVIALPSGVWLAHHGGFGLVATLAAASAVLPLVAALRSPSTPASPSDSPATGLLAGLRLPGQARLALIFAAATAAAGIVDSFLPLASPAAAAALFGQAVAATMARWWAGRYGDSHGHARLLVPALVLAFVGIVGLAVSHDPAELIVALCVFGAGFGIIENILFVLMIEAMPDSGAADAGVASAMWNLAYDAGYGAGPVVFGLFAGHIGYPLSFALTSVLLLGGLSARLARPAAPAAPVAVPPGRAHVDVER
jgi:MFS family permease